MDRLLSEYFLFVLKSGSTWWMSYRTHTCSRGYCRGWDLRGRNCTGLVCLSDNEHEYIERIIIKCQCGACVPQLGYTLRVRMILAARGRPLSPFWCPTCRAQPDLGCFVELGYLCDECRSSTRRRLRRAILRTLYICTIFPRDIAGKIICDLVCQYE